MPNVAVTRRDSILDQIDEIRQRIALRAYELFRLREGLPGDPATDWLNAERDVVSRPAVEFREKDGTFTVVAALPGVDAKDVRVDISAEDLVIRACSDPGNQVPEYDCTAPELFHAVHFPKPVDLAKTRAEYRNGLLRVTAPAVGAVRGRRRLSGPSEAFQ